MTPPATTADQAILAGSGQREAGSRRALRIALLLADTPSMTCSQCGKPATSKRDDVYYCGACSVDLDWQQLIRMVQDAPTPAATGVAAITRSA